MKKILSICLVSFVCKFLIFELSSLSADTLKFSSISVEGNNRISDDAILNFSRLVKNKILTTQELSVAYSRILDTGLFKEINFKEEKNSLIIIVKEYPTINEISFEGNKKFTDDKLASSLTSKRRFVFAPQILEKDLLELQNLYRNSGRFSARIKPKIIALSDNRINLIFEIYEGDIVEIETINFVGNRQFSDRRLRRVLSSKQAGLFRKVIVRDNFINEKISLDRKLLTDFYKNRGFDKFKINGVSTELAEEKDGFFITYNITEGPRFTLGDVRLISDVSDINVTDFEGLIKLKPGDVYDPENINSFILKLEDKIQSKGYQFIRVNAKTTTNMAKLKIDLDFVLERGSKVFVERIDISGNVATLDRVVRRQFFFAEGDPFNPREFRAAKERIRSLGLFSDVSAKIVSGSSDSQIIIDVNVQEKPTGSLTFGAGYSSEAGLGGLIEYGERNFLGRGQSLSFAIKTGKDDQLYELSFFEPMFLRNDLGLGINLSVKDTKKQNAAYDTENIEFQPYVVFPIGEKSKIKIEYLIAQTDLKNPGEVGSIISNEVNEGEVTSSSLGYLFSHDTRDYKGSSRNRYIFQLGQKFIGLGGDKTALKTTMKAAAQRTAFKEDLKLSAEFEGGLVNFSKGNSRVMDRFFLGSRKMRGFETGGVGPRECLNRVCDVSNNDALGGENFAVARFEAEFPLGLPEEYGLSGGLFYDVGNLWHLERSNNDVLYENGSWRQTIGASIFWATPIGPLRFNFSEVLKKELYDTDESFDLTISTRF